MISVDCIVVGGGPAGAATALALSKAGARVALLERMSHETPRFGETLPAAAMGTLARLGVWDQFLADDHARSPGTISYWGSDLGYSRSSIVNPFGDGWHLDRRRFDAMLVRAAADAGSVIHDGCGAVALARSRETWHVTAGGHIELRAPQLVDATGRTAVLARQLGAHRIAFDELVSVAAVGKRDPHTDPRTVIEATVDGYWYSASLPDDRIVAAYFTDRDLLPKVAGNGAEMWSRLIVTAGAMRPRAAAIAPEAIRILSAATCRLDRMADDGWMAVGDAAFALDPLSSAGISNAIEGGLRAARAIVAGATPADYVKWCEEQIATYTSLRTRYYEIERRWPRSPFWSRRTALQQTA